MLAIICRGFLLLGLTLTCLTPSAGSAAGVLDRILFTQAQPPQAVLKSVAFGDGRFVAVGNSGVILTSTDAVHWTRQVAPSQIGLSAVTYGTNGFVAVGQNVALYSADGVNWTQQAIRSAEGRFVVLQAVTYGNGLFVAVGSSGAILTSTNGVQWDAQVSGVTQSLTDIAAGNGRFVAVGSTNVVVSTDGVNWEHAAPGGPSAQGIAYGNGVFVLNPVSMTSIDGLHWTYTPGTSYLTVLKFAGGQFIGFGNRQVLLSDEGVVWTSLNTTEWNVTGVITGIAYGNGSYAAVGNNTILTSQDGAEWASVGAASLVRIARQPRAFSFEQGRFITLGGEYPPIVWFSSDGATWTPTTAGTQEDRVFFSNPAMSSGNGLLVILGRDTGGTGIAVSSDAPDWTVSHLNLMLNGLTFGQGTFVSVGEQGTIARSTNAFRWTTTHSGTTNRLNSVIAGVDRFIAVGDRGTVLTSRDGSDWIAGQSTTSNLLQSVTYGNGTYLAVGALGTVLTSTDGMTWTSANPGTKAALRKAVFGNELFVVVGDSGTILISTNGVNWIRKASGQNESFTAVAYGAGKFLVPGLTTVLEADLAPGQLLGAALSSDGLTFWNVGEIGQVYRIEAATRLRPPDWTEIGSVTNNHLSVPFIDNQAAGERRYYRAVRHP